MCIAKLVRRGKSWFKHIYFSYELWRGRIKTVRTDA